MKHPIILTLLLSLVLATMGWVYQATSVSAISSSIVISEFRTRGLNGGNDEFIELHNLSGTTIDLSGWIISGSAASSTSGSSRLTINAGTTLGPGCRFLATNNATGGYAGPVAGDQNYSIGIVDNGGLALLNTSGAVIDQVGMSSTTFYREGTTLTPMSASVNQSYERKPASANTQDSDNNTTDFVLNSASSNPQNRASTCTAPVPTPTATRTATAPATATLLPITATPNSSCTGAYTPIYQIQGSGSSSPLSGSTVTLEGIVTGDYQGSGALSGFFAQDLISDGNIATSDGVFIYDTATFATNVNVGDRVRVSGRAIEFNGLTEIDTITSVTICSVGNSIPATAVELPLAAVGDWERYEGMLLTIPEPLTVAQNYFLGRYGQLTLSAEGRLYHVNNGLAETADGNARRSFVLDDGRTIQNPNPLPYIGADNTIRAGDTTTGLTGFLSYGAVNASTPATLGYILHPRTTPTFVRENPRTAAPDPVGGNVKVSSYNVLNYFTTFGGVDDRGASNSTEFARQRAKTIAAMTAINADVFGLMEMQNNGSTAISDLVNGLNSATAPGTYAYLTEPSPGTDAIKVSIIYKPGRVTPVGAALNNTDAIFDRPPLAQTFRVNSNNEHFTIIVNHFKSKRCEGATGADADQGDWQGCFNARRTQQAQALLSFISSVQSSSGDSDVLVIGDLNSYAEESPITTLTNGGLVNEIDRFLGGKAYSFVFDGWAGYLDHALTTSSLTGQLSGVTEWHINADEPVVIDYNTEFKPTPDLYSPSPYRSSDHDPVIIGLNLGSTSPTPTATATSTNTPLPIPSATHTATATRTTTATATRTATASATRTATATATRTATATSTPIGGNLIVNPGFESGSNVGWSESSSGGRVLVTTERPRSGTRSARLGGYNSGVDTLSQKVTVPTNGSLTYWWYMTTAESTQTVIYDWMEVRLYDGTTGAYLTTIRKWSNLSTKNTWSQDTLSLSSYAGRSITIVFRVETDSSLLTNFYVDDVSVR
ncbi:MAG: ExeM/NucH family extracellular endonuclease [Ardenticatenales bacterium]|nr:ExeM/NucH family extracellular endonuclease [Ardenticatenales bacterium]